MGPILPLSTSATDNDARRRYGHGHASSVGAVHGIISASGQAAARRAAAQEGPPAPPKVTLVSHVDEHASPQVVIALRVHPANAPLRPSLFPPRRGQRLPDWGLPSTAGQRVSRLREIGRETQLAFAQSVLVKSAPFSS